MPLLEFEELSRRPEVCKPYVKVGGENSFRLYGKSLLVCIIYPIARSVWSLTMAMVTSIGNVRGIIERYRVV